MTKARRFLFPGFQLPASYVMIRQTDRGGHCHRSILLVRGTMSPSLYWYDFETTGTDPARDRAIQFAGVRTDPDLNPVEEAVNLHCYPGDDVIPSPDAMLVTGLSMFWLKDHGLSEFDFVGRIHDAFIQPGTCVTGFNSIRFDDEFARHMFYRNLLDPYAREWQGENSRWDIIDALRMAQALRPEGLNWPRKEDGTPSFRLEALTVANGIDHEDAHDAASDVLATVTLARKLKTAQPKLFNYLFNLRLKKHALAQLYPLGKASIIHVSSMYPAASNCLAIVLPLCSHPTNPNGIICYDLSGDPTDLIGIGPEALHRRVFTANAELDEDENRIPLKTIHVNRSPAIAPMSTLGPADISRLGLDLPRCEAHMHALQHASGIVEKIQDAFSRSEFPPTDDPDLMLYQGGFLSTRDREQLARIRALPATELATATAAFDDPRIPEMIFRVRARSFPASLTATEQGRWAAYRSEKWQHGAAVDQTLQRIKALIADGRDASCLMDLQRYIEHIWQDALGRDDRAREPR
jgi:exodeoxyribonuclease I